MLYWLRLRDSLSSYLNAVSVNPLDEDAKTGAVAVATLFAPHMARLWVSDAVANNPLEIDRGDHRQLFKDVEPLTHFSDCERYSDE